MPGVDGLTWKQYGWDLEDNLQDLSGRLHRGAYHAKPVKRAWIPKAGGRRRPMKKRMRAKLREIAMELRRRLHEPVAAVGAWLRTVVGGWYRYYAVPLTFPDLSAFRFQVSWLWHRALCRRSQKSRMTWERLNRLAARWLPPPRILHPYPSQRVHA